MAYAAVGSVSHTIHLLLNYHQDSISPQFEDQVISLQKHADFFQSFLEDAPERANNWEETIREVTDRAEDIIELLLSDSLLESAVGSSKPKPEKGKYQLPYGFDELERVTEEMESIANRVKEGRRTAAMVGSHDELMKIISRLCGGSSALEITAIVGMAGIGKTTLATNAIDNPSIEEHFDIRYRYTVSHEYSVRGFLFEMLRFMNKWDDESIPNSEDELIQISHKHLYDKRYLIVLDNVWTQQAFDSLKVALPDFGNGSRIILTTRSPELATTTAHHIHEMGLLDEDKSWDMLRQKIFKGDPCPSHLEGVGKMISRSCRGHPLSIQVIAGILAADQTEAVWEDIAENIEIAINYGGEEVIQILSVSYTYLPHYLRPCFLYLGIFQENVEIRVSELIKLWVAEGFLNESGSKSLEETGEEHVEDLVRRGLVSIDKRKSNGRIKSITIHDLMRDLCVRQACVDSFILQVGRFHSLDHRLALATELESCRRVSTFIYGDEVLEAICGSTIRTIMLCLDEGQPIGTRLPIGNVRLLRILFLSNAYNYDLPAEVFDLFHLRYLAFRGFTISAAISNLENLQTLIILPRRMSGEFGKLPDGIWSMPQLRHLCVFCFKLPSQEGAMSALENLQTLCGVVDFRCSRDNLKMIPNLKKLALFFTDVVQDYELHNLIYLHKIEILKIEMPNFLKKQNGISYAFPPTLKKLGLCGLQLQWEDMKTVASLPNLEVLKLRRYSFTGETWETSELGFSELTYLLIEDSNLKNWAAKSSHFPRLKRLVLCLCSHLLEVPNDIGESPTLELIEMDRYNDALWRSAERIQKHQQCLGPAGI